MICASVPLRNVISHIDTTLGLDPEAPVTLRRPRRWFVEDVEDSDPTEVVFLLTSLRRPGS